MADVTRFTWDDGGELVFTDNDFAGIRLVDWVWNPESGELEPLSRAANPTPAESPTPAREVRIEDVPDVADKLRIFAKGVRNVAVEMYNELKPDEFELEVGITASTKAGFVLANVEGGASMKATFTWKSGGPKPSPSGVPD